MAEFVGWVGIPEQTTDAGVSRLFESARRELARYSDEATISFARMPHAVVAWSGDAVFERNEEGAFLLKCTASVAQKPRDAMTCVDALFQEELPDLSSVPMPFAIAIGQNGGKTVDLVSDLMAAQPVYYCFPDQGQLLFATDIRLLLCHPRITPELSRQAIFNFIHFHIIPGSDTVYENVRKLLPSSRLRFRDGAVDIERYWPKTIAPSSRQSASKLQEELIEVMQDSVRRRTHSARPSACFLSGGLDSSTIAGLSSRLTDTHAFSIGFDQEGYDEISFAKIAAKHFGLRHSIHYVTKEDVVRTLPIIAQSFGEPFGNLSAIPVYHCARLAREAGYSSMLAGDGGDELFAGNERYIRHKLLGYYRHLPSSVRRSVEPLCAQLLKSKHSIAYKVGRYVSIAKHDLPVRLLDEFEHFQGFKPETIFEERFLRHIDKKNPVHLLAAIVRQSPSNDLVEQLLWVDWQLTLTDNDLRKVHYTCKAASIRPLFPMLDQDVIALSRLIPSDWKMTRTKLRHFYKQAVTGFLPEEIIHKSKHGFGLPFGEWLRDDPSLAELVSESLRSLRKKEILQNSFIDECMHLHRHVHASYYGALIGAMVLLELWLEENVVWSGVSSLSDSRSSAVDGFVQ